jgi:hypothetical protein
MPDGFPEELGSSIAATIVDSHADTNIEIMHLGGQLTEPTVSSVFFQRPNLCGFECHAIASRRDIGPEDSREDYRHQWRNLFQELVRRLTHYGVIGGRYLNVDNAENPASASAEQLAMNTESRPDNLSDVYGSHWPELRRLKGIHDPLNVLRHNHNIPPPDPNESPEGSSGEVMASSSH